MTMTAELSQAFRTKREGIAFVLDALEAGFPSDSLHVYTVEGGFVSPGGATTGRWRSRRPIGPPPRDGRHDVFRPASSSTSDHHNRPDPIVGGEVVAVGQPTPRLRAESWCTPGLSAPR